jgi:hypothetical protein
MNIKGWRTVAYGLAVAVVPAAMNYLVGIHWTDFGINPFVAFGIGAGIIYLRKVTDTALGVKAPPDPEMKPPAPFT